MSHFEYVSVAMALIFTLAVGRLLSGLSISMEKNRRYWVHTTYIVVLLLVSVLSWWAFWRTYDVQWTALRFLWALSLPSLIYMRTNILLGTVGREPESYFDHFYDIRKRFFAVGILISVYLLLTPWIFGLVPWLKFAPVHSQALSLFLTSVLGLMLRNPTAQGVVVIVSLVAVLTGFWTLPVS